MELSPPRVFLPEEYLPGRIESSVTASVLQGKRRHEIEDLFIFPVFDLPRSRPDCFGFDRKAYPEWF